LKYLKEKACHSRGKTPFNRKKKFSGDGGKKREAKLKGKGRMEAQVAESGVDSKLLELEGISKVGRRRFDEQSPLSALRSQVKK